MGKNLREMTRQEQAAYFKSKDFCGEELKIVMDAVSYGIGADYLQLFEDTTLRAEAMENMFTAMKEDYGVEAAAFLSTVHMGESGRILLEALKSGIPLHELKKIYRNDMLPIELREKILPLMQGRGLIPERFGEKMQFVTEAVRELKESLSRQGSFIEDLRKAMEEKQDIFSAPQKSAEADTEVNAADDDYYMELEEQFRQAREETSRRLRELEAENRNLHEQLLIQKSYATGLQEQRSIQENRRLPDSGNMQDNSGAQGSRYIEVKNSRTEKTDCWRQSRAADAEIGKQPKFHSPFRFPFTRKKPGLLEKLAGELDAGQIAEIRFGIEDGLTEGQLILLADKMMDAEKMKELRMTMKILNERGQGT